MEATFVRGGPAVVMPLAMDSAHAPNCVPPAERLGYVDSLRLAAAGLVLAQHIGEQVPSPAMAGFLALAPGVAGVVLFFLVSGYVIPLSVRGGFEWRSFAVRRVLRIYPLLLAALALVALGGWTGVLGHWADLREAGAGRWLANLLLVQDFVGAKPILGVTWTLIFELAWYGLFALALCLWKGRGADVLGVIVPLALLVLAVASLLSGLRIPLGRPGLIYAAVLGYQAYRLRVGECRPAAFAWSVGVFVAVTWLTAGVSFGLFAHPHLTVWQVIGPWTLALGLFLVVTMARPLRRSALLNRGAIPLVGAASYSVYLLHPIAIVAVLQYGRGLGDAGFAGAALALTGVLALAGYRLVERPGIAMGKRLTARKAGAAAQVCAAPAGG